MTITTAGSRLPFNAAKIPDGILRREHYMNRQYDRSIVTDIVDNRHA